MLETIGLIALMIAAWKCGSELGAAHRKAAAEAKAEAEAKAKAEATATAVQQQQASAQAIEQKLTEEAAAFERRRKANVELAKKQLDQMFGGGRD